MTDYVTDEMIEAALEAADLLANRVSREQMRIAIEAALADRVVVPTDSGVGRLALERRRQVAVEGWSPDHDAEHVDGQLARAAGCYATPPEHRELISWSAPGNVGDRGDRFRWMPRGWPWTGDDWKPADRTRELEKAGALVAAELDRLAAESGSSSAQGSGC